MMFSAFYEAQRTQKKMKHCDLYVVRLLPLGRKLQGSSEQDPSRFGNSKPCVRCLQALDAAGVRRVVFTTGVSAAQTNGAQPSSPLLEPLQGGFKSCPRDGGVGEFGFEVRRVHELLAEGERDGTGHCSRGVRGLGSPFFATGSRRGLGSPCGVTNHGVAAW